MVPPENFHITLHFLGGISARQCELLMLCARQIAPPRIALHLNTCGYFARAGIFWLGAEEVPPQLPQLARALRKASRKAGIHTAHKNVTPHVTLIRNCRARPPLPLTPPDFAFACDGFALFESRTGEKGARYHPLQNWHAQ